MLMQIARTDSSAEVRAEALRRIQDLGFIESVLAKDPDPLVRKIAVERLTDPRKLERIARHDPSPAVRAAATRLIHEQSLLQQIAQSDQDWSVRLAALQRVYDQRLVEERVRIDPSPFVREAAARRVANEEILKSLARPENQPSPPAVTPWVITGRLLHENGSPLAKQEILLLATESATALPQDCPDCASGQSSSDGSFRIELPRDLFAPGQALTLAIHSKNQLVPLVQDETPVKLVVGTAPNPAHLGRLSVKPQDANDSTEPKQKH
jgi:hypothetical protein